MSTELATVRAGAMATPEYVPAVQGMTPASITEAMALANLMAKASLVPTHLQNKPADCLLVIEQAARWGLSPFAVAQATSVISGKLMLEGKLVAAVINTRAGLAERLRFDYAGNGNDRKVTVRGRFHGEADFREVEVQLKDARTQNSMWQKQPDQQLAYHGARVWARRFAPEVMLGIYAPEEMEPSPAPKAPQHRAVSATDPIPGASVTPSSEVPLQGNHVDEDAPWYERTPAKMRRLQAGVTKLNLGKAAADAAGLKGKDRESAVRDARIEYLRWATGRDDVNSTTDLHEDDADRVIQKAEAGEMPS